jgi:hypothetical protein
MKPISNSLICENKEYSFNFQFYHCRQHGIFVWRGIRHELFNLSKRLNQTKSIDPLSSEVLKRYKELGSHMPTFSDYIPIKMKCPYCNGGPNNNGEWIQHYGYLTLDIKDTIHCPWCSAKISIDKALKKNNDAILRDPIPIQTPKGGLPCPDWVIINREMILSEREKIVLKGFKSIWAEPSPFRLTHWRKNKTRTIDLQYDELRKLILFLEEIKKFVEGR